MSEFSHLDEQGRAKMVDVGEKPTTERFASASGLVRMAETTLNAVKKQEIKKGDVLQVARLAGVMAAKQTPLLIPLCHSLPLDSVQLDFSYLDATTLQVKAEVRVRGKTGVEMEALTAVSVAALTIYDMCKALDRSMSIEQIQLDEKRGGASGHYRRETAAD